MNTKPRPLEHLHEASRTYRNLHLWRRLDAVRADQQKYGGWPEWCFCPRTVMWDEFASSLELIMNWSRILTFAAWRPTQGIYHFDETLFDVLWSNPFTEPNSLETFMLPEWCVYIEIGRNVPVPGAVGIRQRGYLYGMFVLLAYESENDRASLSLMLDFEPTLVPMHLALLGTLEESVRVTVSEMNEEMQRDGHLLGEEFVAREDKRRATVRSEREQAILMQDIQPYLSLVQYLCTSSLDITDEQGSGRKPRMPVPVHRKKRKGDKRVVPRLSAPSAPTVWHVGLQAGAAIRRAQADGNASSQAPNSKN